MTDPRAQILCMKWGTKYGVEYVNRLYGMVQRNLSRPFRLVCLTEDRAGIRPEVEILPLPDMGTTEGIQKRGWWKVGLFSHTLGDLSGPALFLDLDVVIVASLEPLFDQPGEVVVPKDYRLVRVRRDYFVGNTSVLRFPVGRYPALMERFRKDFEGIKRRVRNEQEYVSYFFHELGLLRYWPEEWCPSFKHDCVAPWPLCYLHAPRIPEGARVVVFHGSPKPDEAVEGIGGKWYRPILPTPWIRDHWDER
ncbi:MAG: glycosyltransferase [Gemmatimonadota bacterium]